MKQLMVIVRVFQKTRPVAENRLSKVPDKMGNTPLHLAAKGGFNEFAWVLRERAI